jgi:hypothetical protein
MKKLLIAALIAGQVLTTAAPASAQNYSPVRETETGVFSGVRLRVPFGGAGREPVRAGLAFAPTTRTDHQDGRVRTRVGEGLEFGMVGREPMQFSLAGTPVNRLVQGRTGPDGRRLGVSTVGWIAIGVGASLVILVAATAICASDSDCIGSE